MMQQSPRTGEKNITALPSKSSHLRCEESKGSKNGSEGTSQLTISVVRARADGFLDYSLVMKTVVPF